jgi:Flagellar hook-length control protein
VKGGERVVDKAISVQNTPTVKENKKAQGTQEVSDAFEALLGMLMAQTVNMVQGAAIPLEITSQGSGAQAESSMAEQGAGAQDGNIAATAQAILGALQGVSQNTVQVVSQNTAQAAGQILQGSDMCNAFESIIGNTSQVNTLNTQEVQNTGPSQGIETGQGLEAGTSPDIVSTVVVETKTGVQADVMTEGEALEDNSMASKASDNAEAKEESSVNKTSEDKIKSSIIKLQDILTDSTNQNSVNSEEKDKAPAAYKNSDSVKTNDTPKKEDISIKAFSTTQNVKDAGQVRVFEKYHGITQFLLNNTQSDKNSVQQAAGGPKVLEAASRDDVLNQILDRIKVTGDKNISELHVSLKPEELGEVSIRLVLEKGAMTGRIMVENSDVKSLIESNLQDIKDTLRNQHINVSDVNVSVGLGGGNQSQEQRFYQSRWNYGKSKVSGFSVSSPVEGISPEAVSNYGSSLNLLA